MATIYRKTAQGLDEIETRARHLTPRYRSALIMVDGKRNDDDLRKLIGNDAEATLQYLIEQGLIEAAAAAPSKPSSKPATPAAASAAAPAASSPDFQALRRDAVRAVNDTLGPMGEALAMKMEAAADVMQLRPLLEKAVTVIGNARGGGAAAQFAVRFLEAAPH